MNTSLGPVHREVVVTATPDRAFTVFTKELDTWWPHGYRAFGAGGTAAFRAGRLVETAADGTELDWGKVLDWRPGSGLRMSFRLSLPPTDPPTEVHVRFRPVDAPDPGSPRTAVTLTHTGWASLSDPAGSRGKFADDGGWSVVLAGFVDRVGAG